MHLIIIEDELPAARLLQRKLAKLGYTVHTILQSVEESLQWLSKNAVPDLIFMDIQLADGISFEILDQVKPSSSIIFTTAYDEYVLRAFKENSIDYLLKPIDDQELGNALDKFQKLQKPQPSFDLTQIQNLIQANSVHYKERFTLKIGQQIKLVETTAIACFYSEHKGTYAHTKTEHSYLLDYTLDQIQALVNPKDYFRINRGTLIRFDAIKEIAIHSNSRLRIYLHHFQSDNLIVSREKVMDFKKWIDQ